MSDEIEPIIPTYELGKTFSKEGDSLEIKDVKMVVSRVSKESLLEKRARFEAELAEIDELLSQCDALEVV